MPAKIFEIRAAAGKEGKVEVFIYGDIGESWSESSVEAITFVREFSQISASEIDVRINSYGGSVSDGIAIYNAMRRHPAKINVHIDGMAVSIASLIAMAGDRVYMADNAQMMIHAPWGAFVGNASAAREFAEILDRYAAAMSSAYAQRLGESEAQRLLSDGEDHWFSSAEAKAAGFVDEIFTGLAVAASLLLPDRYKRVAKMPDQVINAPMNSINAHAAVWAAEDDRRAEIKGRLSPSIRREGVSDILTACLLDPACTPDMASQRLVAHFNRGEPQEPIARDVRTVAGDDTGRTDEFKAAARDAILLRAGVPVAKPHPGARDIRSMRLVDVAARLLPSYDRESARGNVNMIVQAAMSNSDFPLLLANTAGRALMHGYEMEPASHRIWTRDVEMEDFKPSSRVAMSGAPALERVHEGGAYQYGSLSERAEAYSLATYGKILAFTRQALINDDLQSFTRLPYAFGQSAARLEADKVYAILTGNPVMSDQVALFHANHGNLMTAAALSADSLGLARAAMRKQKGVGGIGVLNIVPRYLIVPAALETKAEQLIASSSVANPAAATGVDNAQWIRNLVLVVDPRLDAVSATAWYLAADFNQVDTIEVAHLAGQRGVFIEQHTKFETDEYAIKARLDFATQAIDWVGLIKNPGA